MSFECEDCGDKFEDKDCSKNNVCLCKWCGGDRDCYSNILDRIQVGYKDGDLNISDLISIKEFIDNIANTNTELRVIRLDDCNYELPDTFFLTNVYSTTLLNIIRQVSQRDCYSIDDILDEVKASGFIMNKIELDRYEY